MALFRGPRDVRDYSAGIAFATDRHGALSYGGMLQEQSFDFAQFNAETAQLHLVVEAPQEFNVSVGQPPTPVTGLEHSGPGFLDEWVGYKALRCQLRAVPVPTCEPVATHMEFAGNPDGYRLPKRIEYVCSAVLQDTGQWG